MIIYLTTNLINGKQYIGQTIRDDKEYLGSGLLMLRAIEKYGKENFKRITLVKCSSQEELDEQEIFWIKILNTLTPNGYNLGLGGNGKGKTSERTKQLLSESTKGKNHPNYGKTLEEIHKPNCQCPFCKNKRGEMKGKSLEEKGHKPNCQCSFCKASRGETKGKNASHYNKPHSEKTKQLISEALKGENSYMYGKKGKDNPNYGKHPLEKTRQLMSDSAKKRWAKRKGLK